LRHRAALGISEVSDGVAVVVSEETGWISVVHGGKMIAGWMQSGLRDILRALFRPALPGDIWFAFKRLSSSPREDEETPDVPGTFPLAGEEFRYAAPGADHGFRGMGLGSGQCKIQMWKVSSSL
jgi:hypothetical protein